MLEFFRLMWTIAICFFVYWAWGRRARWFCAHKWNRIETTVAPENHWGHDDRVTLVDPAHTNVLLACNKCGSSKVVRMRGEPG